MSLLRVALAQVAWSGDRESMLARLERAVRDAVRDGAGLVAFPELCTSPYFCDRKDRRVDDAYERIPDGPTTRRMRTLAKELDVVLVVPLAERDGRGRRYNSAVVIDSDGQPAGTHRKRYLPHCEGSWERSYFRPGEPGPGVFATSVGRVGVAICWERNIPDTWQRLRRARAQLTVVPVASDLSPTDGAPTDRAPTDGAPKDRAATLVQPAAAFLNAMFVATVNRASGSEPDGPVYAGGSYVADPDGNIVGSFGPRHAAVVMRRIDLDDAVTASRGSRVCGRPVAR